MSHEVAVALGSNLGDRRSLLRFAVSRLSSLLTDLRVSDFVETAPVGVAPQADFLNAAVAGFSRLEDPRQLLEGLLLIEREAGRERPAPGAPRTLDLDLILFGDSVMDEPRLCLPHPRFRSRRFVLEPLAQVAGHMVDPVTGLTVGELLAKLRS